MVLVPLKDDDKPVYLKNDRTRNPQLFKQMVAIWTSRSKDVHRSVTVRLSGAMGSQNPSNLHHLEWSNIPTSHY